MVRVLHVIVIDFVNIYKNILNSFIIAKNQILYYLNKLSTMKNDINK